MKINLNKFRNFLIVNSCSSLIYVDKMVEIIKNISTLDEDNINGFLVKKKKEGLSEETLNLYVKTLRAYLKFSKSNIERPKYFKVIRRIPTFITLEELETKIISIIPDLVSFKLQLKIKTLFYFMFLTGLRKGEIEILKREHFDLKNKILKIYQPKTKEERLIPIADKLIILLEDYFKSQPEDSNAFNLGIGSINYIFKLLKDNKINIHPHSLRHSFNVHLKRNNFDLSDRQYLLGHKNINSTARYEHIDIEGNLKEKFKNL
jgi:integrase/recombinase XerD